MKPLQMACGPRGLLEFSYGEWWWMLSELCGANKNVTIKQTKHGPPQENLANNKNMKFPRDRPQQKWFWVRRPFFVWITCFPLNLRWGNGHFDLPISAGVLRNEITGTMFWLAEVRYVLRLKLPYVSAPLESLQQLTWPGEKFRAQSEDWVIPQRYF
jgi:hypothetical protein